MKGKNNIMDNLEGFVPPHNIEIEKIILFISLYDKVGYTLCSTLKPEHFYGQPHNDIWEAINTCQKKHNVVDLMLVADILKTKPDGQFLITYATTQLPTSQGHSPERIINWVKVIKEYYVLRQIIDNSHEVAKIAYSAEKSGSELLELQSNKLLNIQAALNGDNKSDKITDLISETIKEIEETKEGLRGFSSGSQKIDEVFGGWAKGELIILAARPGQGKTARMLDFVYNAVLQKKKVKIFSLEMKATSLMKRMASRISGVENYLIGRNKLESHHWARLNDAFGQISDFDISIDDNSAATLGYISGMAKVTKLMSGLDMICIDYLQLIRSENNKANRDIQIGEITRGLKSLSKELDVPIIALCQLSREVEKRADKKPMLSDLRESGNIEQDADIVMGLYRPCEYYDYDNNPDVKAGYSNFDPGSYPNVSQVIPMKFREGAKNFVITEYFFPETYRYSSGDYAQENYVTSIKPIGENHVSRLSKPDEDMPF